MLQREILEGHAIERAWSRVGRPFVEAYVSIFNDDWGESWTRRTANARVRTSLRCAPGRHPVLSLLWDGDRVAAFACGSVITARDAVDERDLPGYFALGEGQLERAREALFEGSPMPFLLGSGWAVRREYREMRTLAESCLGFVEHCAELGCTSMRGWTSRRSRAFYLYVAAGARVLFDFEDDARLCLFTVSTSRVLLLGELRHSGLGLLVTRAMCFAKVLAAGLLREQRRAGLALPVAPLAPVAPAGG